MSLTLPSLRVDFAALETYRCGTAEPLEIPVTVLRGLRDAALSPEEAAAWRERTSKTAMIHEVDAGHFFVETHRAWVLARVVECLRAVQADQAT